MKKVLFGLFALTALSYGAMVGETVFTDAGGNETISGIKVDAMVEVVDATNKIVVTIDNGTEKDVEALNFDFGTKAKGLKIEGERKGNINVKIGGTEDERVVKIKSVAAVFAGGPIVDKVMKIETPTAGGDGTDTGMVLNVGVNGSVSGGIWNAPVIATLTGAVNSNVGVYSYSDTLNLNVAVDKK